MQVIARQLKRTLLAVICVAWIMPWAMLAKGQDDEIEVAEADIDLVEHSGEIFIGTIDIVTKVYELERTDEGPGVNTEYTVLVSDVLKGELKPQSIIVVWQDGGTLSGVDEYHEGDGPLIPGNVYLFFARHSPGTPVYLITEPTAGNLPITSNDERADLVVYWSGIVARTACEHTDVLKLDGVTYARRDWNDDKRYLEREWVGPTIATVSFQDTTATGCRDDLPDGIASEIPRGAKVQELKGYATSFRVAVRLRDGHRYLYEAIWSETATTGADLLDIRRRVTEIRYADLTVCDDPNAICDLPELVVSNSRRINAIVDLVLSAPVDQSESGLVAISQLGHSFKFYLKDGSTVYLWTDAESGLTPSGLRLPIGDLATYLWGE